MSVSDIAAAVNTSLQNTSQHLRLMKDKGILQSRRDGRSIYYRVAANELTRNCPIFHDAGQVKIPPYSDSDAEKEKSDD
jgi:DNA-binding transcriptional ArsR family regulator